MAPARPITSAGGSSAQLFTTDEHAPASYDEMFEYSVEEEDEESEDEDVFAFLPPSTAEQQQHQLELQQEMQNQSLSENAPSSSEPSVPPAIPIPMPIHNVTNPFAHNPPLPVSYPPPALDVSSPNPQISEQSQPIPIQPIPTIKEPSLQQPQQHPLRTSLDTMVNTPPYEPNPATATTPPDTYQASEGSTAPLRLLAAYHSPYPATGLPVETPPSTDSHGEYAGNPNANAYRLRRINTGGSTRSQMHTATTASAEVHIDFPIGSEKDSDGVMGITQSAPTTSSGALDYVDDSKSKVRAKTEDGLERKRRRRKKSTGMEDGQSGAGSRSRESITPSMLEEDSTGSIK